MKLESKTLKDMINMDLSKQEKEELINMAKEEYGGNYGGWKDHINPDNITYIGPLEMSIENYTKLVSSEFQPYLTGTIKIEFDEQGNVLWANYPKNKYEAFWNAVVTPPMEIKNGKVVIHGIIYQVKKLKYTEEPIKVGKGKGKYHIKYVEVD